MVAVALPQDPNYLHKAAQSAVFVYDTSTQPCAPPNPTRPISPIGSGFVVGLAQKGNPPGTWKGWKFLVTCEHVIAGRSAVILRLNRIDSQEVVCFSLPLIRQGAEQNVFSSDGPGVDLVAINIPDIPNTDPVIFDYTLILDNQSMKELEVHEGTEVFAVGYLLGYSGLKQNYPVTKFGKVALLTEELWYLSPRDQLEKVKDKPAQQIPAASGILEQAYLIELQNVPGLSGAPVLLQSPQFRVDEKNQFQFRRMPPYVFGILKGVLTSPLGGSQGVAAVEPASHLRDLLKRIADALKAKGAEVELEAPAPTKN
jgi:hypothetical protein